jgi:hypothetical protein
LKKAKAGKAKATGSEEWEESGDNEEEAKEEEVVIMKHK